MIRPLNIKDAPKMLEWMHDQSAEVFQYNFKSMNINDCENFIKNIGNDDGNYHFAIVDDKDDYLGTISLKNHDKRNKNAEYAIVLHPSAKGKGVATKATDEILCYGFNELGLERIYLNVRKMNKRAISFYEKYGFVFEGTFRNSIEINGKMEDLLWYSIIKEEFVCKCDEKQ